MKFARFLLFMLVAISTTAFAQSEAHKDAHKSDAQKPGAPKSEAQQSFDKLKTLAGTWEGKVTGLPEEFTKGKINELMQVTLRVTSRGNALMHEMKGDGPDDPITMLYLDNDRLLLTHFCDAGNRPRMVGTISPDGRSVEFEFLDVAGNTLYGHMHHALFTFIDADHHTEEWTFILKGDKLMKAHLDLQRAKPQQASAR
jgi:hypothetical protein